MKSLDGTVAVVTGGAYGLGRLRTHWQRKARTCCRRHPRRVGDGRSHRRARRAGPELAGRCHRRGFGRGFRRGGETNSSIGVLVNNTAFLPSSPNWRFARSPGIVGQGHGENVKGPFLMAKHVAPVMRAASRGKISMSARAPLYKRHARPVGLRDIQGGDPGPHAVPGAQAGPDGINVNTLAPGLIESPSVGTIPII